MSDDPIDARYILTGRPVMSIEENRGVDVELLADEIGALRTAAQRYGDAMRSDSGSVGEAGLDLEKAAIRYVRKLDDESYKASRPDYAAIVEAAERDRGAGN